MTTLLSDPQSRLFATCAVILSAQMLILGGYTAARVLHALVYIKEMQPFRTITYAIGSMALIGMMVLIRMTVLA